MRSKPGVDFGDFDPGLGDGSVTSAKDYGIGLDGATGKVLNFIRAYPLPQYRGETEFEYDAEPFLREL